MKMNHIEALKVFGLSKGVDFDVVKRAYLELFYEHNAEGDVRGLLEWIAELLPDQTLRDYIADIKDMNEESE